VTILAVVLVPVAYALGTFPSAVMIARSRGIDIMAEGSGNPGASNVARVLGTKYGALVFILDALKGVIAALIGVAVTDGVWAYVFIAAALLGHMFPVTRRFHGGKGIATAGGAMLVMHPLVSASLILLWYVLSRVTKKASIGSVIATVGMPIGCALDGASAAEVAAIILLGLLVLGRHAGNLKRLVKGEELATH
jgi:acyl phosphate:glycerol-3-phosphate acyltransferase